MTGPPAAICFSNTLSTEPFDPITLPNRTAEKLVLTLTSPASNCFCARLSIIWTTISQIRLDAPIMLVGLTALSVEIRTNLCTPHLNAASAILYVPPTLFLMASLGESSMSGTCLCAAAWKMMSGWYVSITELTRFVFLTEPMSAMKFSLSPYFALSSRSIQNALFS